MTQLLKKLINILTFRMVNILLVLASVIGMLFGLYLQKYQNLEPCPLCIFQRVGLIGMGVISLLVFIHHPKSALQRRIYSGLALLSIGWSVTVAGRHVWLQHLPPDQVPSCGPGLDFWMDTFPILEVFKLVLSGSGECAKVSWTFLGLSLPTWSLIYFSGLAILLIWQLIQPIRLFKDKI